MDAAIRFCTVAGSVVPPTGSIVDLAAANWTTSLGAACYLA